MYQMADLELKNYFIVFNTVDWLSNYAKIGKKSSHKTASLTGPDSTISCSWRYRIISCSPKWWTNHKNTKEFPPKKKRSQKNDALSLRIHENLKLIRNIPKDLEGGAINFQNFHQ